MAVVRPRVPGHLRAHALWEGSFGGVVYVTERRRRRVGAYVALLSLGLSLVLIVSHGPVLLILAGLVATAVGAGYGLGGNSGFYLVQRDGKLGNFLGRRHPNLGALRRVRLR